MGALIKTIHSVCVCVCIRLLNFFNGFRKSPCIHVDMDALCMWVAHVFIYAFLTKAALTWMNGFVVALIMRGRNQSTSREAEER